MYKNFLQLIRSTPPKARHATRIARFKDFSLRTKLLIAFSVVTLIPLVGVSAFTVRSTRQALTDQTNAALHGAAVEAAESLDNYLTDNLTYVRSASQLHIFEEYLLLPASGRPGSETETQLYADLRTIVRRDQTYITSVGLIDKFGNSVADTSPAEVGVNKTQRNYFVEAVQTGLPYVSPVEISPVSKQTSLYFSAPVRDENGETIGVLRIRYDASVLQQFVTAKADDLGIQDGDIVLFDENFIHLADGDAPEQILKSVVPLPSEKIAQLQAENRLPDQPVEELSVNLPEFAQGLANISEQPIFAAETELSGAELEQVAGASLQIQPWLLVVAQTQAIYLAPVEAATRTITLLTLGVMVLVAAAAVFVAQTIARPVLGLTQVAQEIAAGKPNVQVKVESQDEIGVLAESFNAMTAQLTRRASELATVADVGNATSTILEVDQLLQNVVDLTKESFNLYHAHIYLLDEKGENLVLAKGAGEPGRQMLEKGLSIPLSREQSLVARAARERTGVAVNDVTQAPDFLPNPLLPNTRSELAVPIVVGNQVLGVFDVQSDVVGRFTDLDINIQTTLASQVAVSVQNARQVQRTIRTAAELASFRGAVNEAAIVAITDVTGKIEFANDKFVEISKYSQEELLGQDHRILNSGYHSKEFMRDLWVTIAKGKVWRGEIRNKAKDGSFYWVDSVISPVLNEQGKPVQYVAIRYDITQRKELELETAKRAENLAKLDAITRQIQGTAKIEDALQITARELGLALGLKPTRITLDTAARSNDGREKN